MSLKNRPRQLCKVTYCAGRVSTNTHADLISCSGVDGNGNCYLMHRKQSDGWLYSADRRLLKGFLAFK